MTRPSKLTKSCLVQKYCLPRRLSTLTSALSSTTILSKKATFFVRLTEVQKKVHCNRIFCLLRIAISGISKGVLYEWRGRKNLIFKLTDNLFLLLLMYDLFPIFKGCANPYPTNAALTDELMYVHCIDFSTLACHSLGSPYFVDMKRSFTHWPAIRLSAW